MKFEFKQAKIIEKINEGRGFLVELSEGIYANLESSLEESIEPFIGKEVEVLSTPCLSRIYGGRTYCGKVIADHIKNLPEEHREKAKQMLYNN